jgi:hypothetical protein
MKRSTKIILSVFAALAVLMAIGMGLAAWFVANNAERWAQSGRDKMDAGRAAGASLDSRGCVDRAMAEYRKDTGPIMALAQRFWLSGCLETAKPEYDICPTIKGESVAGRIGELIASRTAFCARHDLTADQNCQQMAEAVESFCFGIPTPGSELLESESSQDDAQPSAGDASQTQ